MKGDFSRIAFDRTNHYTGVVHQQGRVWLDSDWNEDVLERLDLLQQEIYDIVGACGVPAPGTAFQISPGPDPAHPENFAIGGGIGNAGRAYVSGLLARMEAPTTYFDQPDYLDAPPIQFPQDGSEHFAIVYLEVWRRLITYLEDPSIAEIALGGPDTSARIKTIAQVKAFLVPPGTACSDLMGYLPPTDATLTTIQPAQTQPTDLCSLPDPANYTGSENHLYRVEVHTGGSAVDSFGGGLAFNIALAADVFASNTALTLATPLTVQQMAAVRRWGNVLTLNDSNGNAEKIYIAAIPASGTVLVLSSPLANTFTVARRAAVIGLAQFKWSRDNGTAAVAIQAVAADRQILTVASLGRDQASALKSGDIVEIVDDASELGSACGHLTMIAADPDPDLLTIVIADPLPATFRLATGPNPPATERHLVLRRWDGRGVARTLYSDTATPDMNLGNGVQIRFSGADLRPGDYWNIVARSADGSVQSLIQQPPIGINRYVCPLAIIKWAPLPVGSPPASPPILAYAMQLVQDCRRIFTPLNSVPGEQMAMHAVGVFSINANTGSKAPLLNDQTFALSSVLGGIDLLCDQNVDTSSVSRPTVFLTLEIPFTAVGQGVATPVVGYQTLSIVGTVVARGRTISWRFDPNAAKIMPQIVALPSQTDRGVLCRFTVKGDFVWSLGNPRLYLDGSSFGQPGANGGTSLILPSGDKRRGGDFETWFWLTADAPAIAKSVEVPTKTVKETETKLTDKVAERIKEKIAEKFREKTKDKDKISEKLKEKAKDTDKARDKIKDKIKDRELAPLPNGTTIDLHPEALQPETGTARHFIRPEERPSVGQNMLSRKPGEA